jgi:hypothetical protein
MSLRRYTELRPSLGTRWPPEVRAAILARDGGRCVCRRANFPPEVIAVCPSRPVELDHVRAGGVSLKSRSTVDNGVCLSNWCHRWKTEHGRDARPLLIDYIEDRVQCTHVEPEFGCPTCPQLVDPYVSGRASGE